MEIRTPFARVDAFRRPGTRLSTVWVDRDHVLTALDANDPGEPRTIFTISRGSGANAEIAVSPDMRRAYVTDGFTIHEVADSARAVATIERVLHADSWIDEDHRFNWTLAVSQDGAFLFSQILSRSPGSGFLARIALGDDPPRVLELAGVRLLDDPRRLETAESLRA